MIGFELAYGSIIGKNHLGNHQILKGINNQDSFFIRCNDNMTLGLIADGCSSTPSPEVGSYLLPKMLAVEMEKYMNDNYFKYSEEICHYHIKNALDATRNHVLLELRSFIEKNLSFEKNYMELEQNLHNYFSTTIIGFCITKDVTVIFNIGDGIYFVNGEMTKIGPYPGNAPPYMIYELFQSFSLMPGFKEKDFEFNYVYYPTSEIKTLLIGSDGVEYLVEAEEKEIPGIKQKVGPISQFWTQDAYFENPDLVSRKLSVLNKEHHKYDTEEGKMKISPGLLFDDTTMIVVRREKEIIEEAVNEETGEQNENIHTE